MKVLILSARTGGGHMRCAQAIDKVLKECDPEGEVRIVDGLEYVNRYFNKVVVDGYKFSATKLSKLYGILYHMANNTNSLNKLIQKSNNIFARKLIPLFFEFKPDVVVTTHAFLSVMCSKLIDKGYINVPVISIITDFAPHTIYINSGVTEYVVSSVQMVDELEKTGVDRNIIHPFGIPIDPVFFEKDEQKREHLTQLGFDPDIPTVLVMAGSFGVTDILKLYENINEIELDFQIIVITGRNMKLFDEFNSILSCNEGMRIGKREINFNDEREPSRKEEKMNITKKTMLIYFTEEVHKYMQLSDLIITKPGGLTVTESLASCLPMVLFRGIPGQETDNTEYLCNNNLAISVKRNTVADTLYQLLKYPDRLLSMRESCERLNNRDSSYKVYELIKKAAENSKGKVMYNGLDKYKLETDTNEDEEFYSEINEVLQEYREKGENIDLSDNGDNDEEFESKLEEIKARVKENFKKIREDILPKKDNNE